MEEIERSISGWHGCHTLIYGTMTNNDQSSSWWWWLAEGIPLVMTRFCSSLRLCGFLSMSSQTSWLKDFFSWSLFRLVAMLCKNLGSSFHNFSISTTSLANSALNNSSSSLPDMAALGMRTKVVVNSTLQHPLLYLSVQTIHIRYIRAILDLHMFSVFCFMMLETILTRSWMTSSCLPVASFWECRGSRTFLKVLFEFSFVCSNNFTSTCRTSLIFLLTDKSQFRLQIMFKHIFSINFRWTR